MLFLVKQYYRTYFKDPAVSGLNIATLYFNPGQYRVLFTYQTYAANTAYYFLFGDFLSNFFK